MLISDTIAAFIDEMLDNCGGTLEIKRNDLARQLGCVPSQINYVVASRFTPEKGYLIESRRGGGGYIRIVRKVISADELLASIFHSVGNTLAEKDMESILSNLYAADLITSRECRMIRTCLSSATLANLPKETQNCIRADSFRSFILMLMH